MESVKELMCVNYPGVVKNESKAIESLGGSVAISEAFSADQRTKLRLNFRPHDRLSNPITANKTVYCTTLLVKIRVKKKEKKVVAWELVGKVAQEFTFGNFCDFQYLGIDKRLNVYDQILPTSLNTEWFDGEGPSILLPNTFSRSETIQGYFALRKTDKEKDNPPPEIISSLRPKRHGVFAIFVGFEDPEVPTGPKGSLTADSRNAELDIIREVLEKRPVVSRPAMSGLSGLSDNSLRDLMPFLCYHFHNGPWRAQWVKFGYDPRKNPASRIYQTLDFRAHSLNEELSEDRSIWPRARSINKNKSIGSRHDLYILKPGRIPPSKQFFYQMCDIQLEEVESLLEAAEVRSECHPTDGWYPEGTKFACRRIGRKYVMEAMAQYQNDSTTFESSQLSSDGEDDDFNEYDDVP